MRGQSPQNVSGNPGGAATSAQEFQGSSCWSLWVSGYGTAGARRAGRGECPGCPRKDGCGGTFRACQADGMEPPCAQQGPAEGVGGCQDLRLPESTLNSFRAVGAPVVLGEGGRVVGTLARTPGFRLDACGISPGERSGLSSCPQPMGGLVLLEDPPPVFSASLACLQDLSMLSPEHKNPTPPGTSTVNAGHSHHSAAQLQAPTPAHPAWEPWKPIVLCRGQWL